MIVMDIRRMECVMDRRRNDKESVYDVEWEWSESVVWDGRRMTEYDERGNKRYEGGWSGDWIDHQICLQYLISQVVMAL